MQNNRLFIILFIVIILLLIPIIAMQFSDEVNWGIFDFIVAGVLLFGTGLIFELILRKVKTKKSQIATTVILFILLILIWVELAVGIFGTPFSGS